MFRNFWQAKLSTFRRVPDPDRNGMSKKRSWKAVRTRLRLGVVLSSIAALSCEAEVCFGKDVLVRQGQKTAIGFAKCTDGWWCHYQPCFTITKADGSQGRAHLYSEWWPGRNHDLDVQQGQYCDKLDLYFGMAYTLYAVPESDVTVGVPTEMSDLH